ncbi:MAG: DUF1638 domain-containing protein [Peptococcales bacterium]
MQTVFIGCRTIEDEINAVFKALPTESPIFWIESGLHNYPDKLKNRIQEEIDKITATIANVENIVILFGFCGNCINGLYSSQAKLIIPKVEDCISLLMGGDATRQNLNSQAHGYFLTSGWLRYENNIYYEYEQCIKKYGLAKAQRIFKVMLKNYSVLYFIDTGTYDLEETMKKTYELAQLLNLEQKIIPGNDSLIAKGVKGEWDDNFLIVPAGDRIKLNTGVKCPNQF